MMKIALQFVVMLCVSAVSCLPPVFAGVAASTGSGYCDWQMQDYAIEKALCGLTGDAQRGRQIAIRKDQGNCLACHQLPIPEEESHGNIGPSLLTVADRYSKAQLRMRVVDESRINPDTIMPGFYRQPELFNRVAASYWGKTFLSAQQVEDLVSYLSTLRESRP